MHSSSFVLGVIFHVFHSSISVLHGSFSTLVFRPTLRHGCLERSASGLSPCILGCTLASQLSGPSIYGKMRMRIAGCTLSWKERRGTESSALVVRGPCPLLSSRGKATANSEMCDSVGRWAMPPAQTHAT